MLHATDAPDRTAESYKLGFLALLQKCIDCLIEINWPVSIHLNMLLQDRDGHPVHRGEVLADTGIGDDHVQMFNAVFPLKGLESSCWISGGLGINLDSDQVRGIALGKRLEGLGRSIRGIANGCDDGGVGTSKECLSQTTANATVGASNEIDCVRHGCNGGFAVTGDIKTR